MQAALKGVTRRQSTGFSPRTWQTLKRTMATTQIGEKPINFGPFEVTKQVFVKTPHSFGLVNLKPIVPGHILICPFKPHQRLTDLSAEETTDLFTTVQLAQRMLAKQYFKSADTADGSFTIAVQDGPEAGQTVTHVHVHVIPRSKGDVGDQPDEIYVKMAGEEGNVGGALWDVDNQRPKPGGGMPKVEDADRHARSAEDMQDEAKRYKTALNEMGIE